MPITLVAVNADNWRDTLQLAVHPDQLGFVSEYAPIAAYALAKAFVRPDDLTWIPYAIYADDQLVGFAELACLPESADRYWLYHFFIDHAQQGKGYGRQALNAFIGLVRENYPRCREIRLSVHPDNAAAYRLYIDAGFQPTGEAYDNGELVLALRVA